MGSKSVGVQLQGREYQIRSDADPAWLQRVAGYVDAAMTRIRDETNTVDSLDVALLTSLNLAREVITSRTQVEDGGPAPVSPDSERIKSLIELVESVTDSAGDPPGAKGGAGRGGEGDTPLLTLPAGDEVDAMDADLMAPMGADGRAKGEESGRG